MIANYGGGELTVTSITSSVGDIVISGTSTPFTIAPQLGEGLTTHAITLTLTASTPGIIDGMLNISSNAPSSPEEIDILGVVRSSPPITIYVSTTGDDNNYGLSLGTAKRTIKAGLDLALDGDTVLVADGTYTGVGNTDLHFDKAITLKSVNGPESTIIDCQDALRRTRGFVFDSGETAASVLDGFTIKNGDAFDGAGIYCVGSSPTITNCIITYLW